MESASYTSVRCTLRGDEKAEQVWMGNGRQCLQVLDEVSPDVLMRPEPANQQRRQDTHQREPWEETFGKLT